MKPIKHSWDWVLILLVLVLVVAGQMGKAVGELSDVHREHELIYHEIAKLKGFRYGREWWESDAGQKTNRRLSELCGRVGALEQQLLLMQD